LSLQPELALHEGERRRRYELPVCRPHPGRAAVQIGVPELEDVPQLGESWRQIVVLPDMALQPWVIGQAVEGSPPAAAKPRDLLCKSLVHGSAPQI
jgi:hypothetical protein